MKKGCYQIFFGMGMIVLFLTFLSAQNADATYVLSNSEDWKDVYSIVHFANLQGLQNDFLVSTSHGRVILNGIRKDNVIHVISSEDQPFIINYPQIIESQGFAGVSEQTIDEANLELIEELPDVENFIIVADTYGYNAVAVSPYAVQNDAWVFIADRSNIDEIDSILANRDTVDEILIYGYVDRDVRDALARYDPIIIDTGDRFQDNVEIVKRYRERDPVKQIVLTNGEFIEKEVMLGREPVLFTGSENVPDQIKTYLSNSDIEVGVLVGADLVGAGTNIRRSTGVSVIVKFARGARVPTGGVSAVEGLDLFYLPVPLLDLGIHSAKYNAATSQLELTYLSQSNVPIYVRGTLTPISDGVEGSVIGDVDPVFIGPEDYKTVIYSDVEMEGEDLEVEIYTLFGDTPSSLERIIEGIIPVERVNIIDACDVQINKIKYNTPKGTFYVRLENVGEVDCWVDVELEEVWIDDSLETLGTEGSVELKSGKNKWIKIVEELTEEDLEENEFVSVVAYYGEQEDSLVKVARGKFELQLEFISYATVGLILIIILVFASLIILFVVWRRRRKDDDW